MSGERDADLRQRAEALAEALRRFAVVGGRSPQDSMRYEMTGIDIQQARAALAAWESGK